MDKLLEVDENTINEEDRIAMAETYRIYQFLNDEEKNKIPHEFIETLVRFGDFLRVKPYGSKKEISMHNISQKARYLVMYMCTFNV